LKIEIVLYFCPSRFESLVLLDFVVVVVVDDDGDVDDGDVVDENVLVVVVQMNFDGGLQ